MRPVWTGALSFGLVNIPVRLVSAVQAKERVSFRLLHKTDHSPIRYERVCEKDGETVDWSDIVKGYEYTKGKFVALTDSDFKAATVESSKTIEIMDFVKADEIDPRYFETPYYLIPGEGGDKPYALLREAIRKAGVVGIGKVTMRTNVLHLAGVKTVDDAMVLEIMRFAGELVDADTYKFPGDAGVRPQELQMAEQLIENLSSTFDPSKYVDDYHDKLVEIIQAKMEGKKIEKPKAAEREGTKVIDLVSRLQESIEAAKGAKKGAKHARRSTTGAGRGKKAHTHRTRRTRRTRQTA